MPEQKEDSYDIYISCCNCNNQEIVAIPKGITTNEYRRDKICFYCGCRMDGGERK